MEILNFLSYNVDKRWQQGCIKKKEVWIEDSWNKCYFKWQKSSDKNKCTFQCSILAHLKAICFLQQKDHTETKNKGWKGCVFLLNIFKWQILFTCIYETCIWKHSFYCASLIIALENIFKSKQKLFEGKKYPCRNFFPAFRGA